jgi:hypothetical protein
MRHVRRVFAIFVLVGILAIPTAAALAARRDANDGTLSVRNGVGRVWVGARGALVGRFDSGTLKVFDPADGDTLDVKVWGADRVRSITDTTDVYSGTDIRFRIVGRFRVTVTGNDIDLSAVGQGRVGLRGNDLDGPDGSFWFNDGPRRSLPNADTLTYYDLNAGG